VKYIVFYFASQSIVHDGNFHRPLTQRARRLLSATVVRLTRSKKVEDSRKRRPKRPGDWSASPRGHETS